MTKTKRIAAITGVILMAGIGSLSIAFAGESPSGSSFGRHVSNCAQTMGFSGEHNPGMHQGFADWNGMRCEPAA
jgi:hypothetical protein